MFKTLPTTPRVLAFLILCHIAIIAASNYLVQLPVQVFGYHTTWGAFTFPFIFLVTDLTVRLLGQSSARKVIFFAMMPALLISYFFSSAFDGQGHYVGLDGMTQFNLFVFRIVVASFVAYVVGQLLDIFVFNRFRQKSQWWAAPVASTFFGTLIDSICFFTIAFYKSPDEFMAAHWVEIGTVDYCFKLAMGLCVFVPVYGVLLDNLQRLFARR